MRWRMTVVALLVACGSKESKTSSPKTDESTASAKECNCPDPHKQPAAHSVKAIATCLADPDRLLFHAIFDVDYTKSSMGPMKARDLYSFTCDRKSRECLGATVDIDTIDEGKPLGPLHVNALSNAKIVSETGDVIVVQWGPLRTFTVDFARSTITYVESNDSTYGRAEVPCKAQRNQ